MLSHLSRARSKLRFCTVIIFSAIFSYPALAEVGGVTGLALDFGSPRHQLWAILKEKPRGGERFAFSIADQLSLNPRRQQHPYITGSILTFTPTINYDRNVNNGFNGDTIYIWGLPFSVDENSRAVEALTVGGALTSGIAFGIAPSTTLSFSTRAGYQRALSKDFEIFTGTAVANLGYTTQGWSYINVGLLLNREERDLSDETVKIGSFTVGKLFGTPVGNLHDVSMTLIRAEQKSTWHDRVRFDWTSFHSSRGVLRMTLEHGEGVEAVLLPQNTFSTSFSSYLFNAPSTITVLYSKYTGGRFFGSEREDKIYKIRLERKISQRLISYFSYEKKVSTLNSFNDQGIDIGISFSGF
ncbi:hypothetical protein EP867_19455, partial [Falsigemmobacter intermedius]